MAILHKNISAEGDIHNPKWFSGANNGDVAWRNELGVLESTDELILPAALDFVDGSAAPPTSNSGDIYVISSGASVNAGWGTVSLGDWVRYDGTTWNDITPQKSTLCYNKSSDGLYSYDGVNWNAPSGGIASVTSAEKAALSPSIGDFVYDTDLSSLQRYNGSAWITQAGVGVLGIASNIGEYTYYSTYTLAMSAAVAGDTVEQFGNITETSNVTITIKDGVSINMNGYTYTTDGSTVNAFYHDDNGYEETRFQNGTIRHINTGGSGFALWIAGESHMDCTGLIVIGDGAYCLNFNTNGAKLGRLIGGSYIHNGGSGWNHIVEGKVFNAYFNTGDGAVRISGGAIDSCNIDGCVNVTASGDGIISNSKVIGGTYTHAIINEGTVVNTYAESLLFQGINNGNNGLVDRSTGKSNASWGIYSVAGTVNNSKAISTASYGMYLNNANAIANFCIAESSASAAIRLNRGKIYNCKAICTFNNATGDGILITQNDGFEVIDCFATVVNSSAFAIDGEPSVSNSGIISGLKGQGMTVLIGNPTNTAGTIDTFGNGLL
jgi:hypothetical protein